MNVVLNHDMAKATLEKVADPMVPPIRVTRVATFKLRHEFWEITVRRHYAKMEVILHQGPGEKLNAIPLFLFDQDPQEFAPITIIFENSRLPVTSIHDVVSAATDSFTRTTCHAAS